MCIDIEDVKEEVITVEEADEYIMNGLKVLVLHK